MFRFLLFRFKKESEQLKHTLTDAEQTHRYIRTLKMIFNTLCYKNFLLKSFYVILNPIYCMLNNGFLQFWKTFIFLDPLLLHGYITKIVFLLSCFFRSLIIAINDRDREINRLGTKIRMLQQECIQAKSSIQMHRNTVDKLQKNLTEEKKAKEHVLNRYKTFLLINLYFNNY